MDTLMHSLGTCLAVYIQQKRAMESAPQCDSNDIQNIIIKWIEKTEIIIIR